MSALASHEVASLRQGLAAYLALPTSTDLAPDSAEAIFAWAIGGTMPAESSSKKRSKLLFDVTRDEVGWSLKTYRPTSLDDGRSFEVVLARASVEAKSRTKARQERRDFPGPLDQDRG